MSDYVQEMVSGSLHYEVTAVELINFTRGKSI